MSDPQSPTPPPNRAMRPAARMNRRAPREAGPFDMSFNSALFVAVLWAICAFRYHGAISWETVVSVLIGVIMVDTIKFSIRRHR